MTSCNETTIQIFNNKRIKMLAQSLILKNNLNEVIIEIYDFDRKEFIEEDDELYSEKIATLAKKYNASHIYYSGISNNHMWPKERLVYSIVE
jgi:hypothetical protein